ncbi:PREDICTED: solute carrier family 25 member 40-like [Priapulus caudatus]|uniref:Solute carrier family 25 member 40-like n=1 Tax=Priapulus caudatus TaxID=37621 RepID=A0ABM1E9G6_PRICU|nr:PREDICTED: solute carrier family 25 member 40-like [Priapulus caudatus]
MTGNEERDQVVSRPCFDTTSITPKQQIISSCSGALVTSFFVTPLDVVKIRLQSQQKPLAKGQFFIYSNGLMDHLCLCVSEAVHAIEKEKPGWHEHQGEIRFSGTSVCTDCSKIRLIEPVHVVKFGGTADAFVKIARHEGVQALWSGLPPTLVMAVPATMIYFTSYDNLRDLFYRCFGVQSYNLALVMSAGALARVIAVTVISPLELVRTKMQSEQLSYKEIGAAIRKSVSNGGILSLWRGLSPTLLRDVPFSAIYWSGYEYLKSVFLRSSACKDPSLAMSFTAGAVSGSVAAVITVPFDVVKTHRQIELGQRELAHVATNPNEMKTSHLIRRLYTEKGFRSLFAGIVPRIVKVAPACAIMISSYEFGKHFFRTRNARLAGDPCDCT